MIKKPDNWDTDYTGFCLEDDNFNMEEFIERFIGNIKEFLERHRVINLAYSGGIDSTIMLAIMTEVYGEISTYTIGSRKDHPDVIYSGIGCSKYGAERNLYIPEVIPDRDGDTAVRGLFNKWDLVKIITCDGIDEFMCGYYSHRISSRKMYIHHIKELVPKHLIPLDINSGETEVYLPYLDHDLVSMMLAIPLQYKVDEVDRKKVVVAIARHLGVPEEIIMRNKYGFCDALLERDK